MLSNSNVNKFLLPPLRLQFSQNIAKYATSCIDISDGLILDSAKLARNSKCGLNIISNNIPISDNAKKEVVKKNYTLKELISAGDDYELAFSVKVKHLNYIKKVANKFNIKLTTIGNFYKGKGTYLDNKSFKYGFSHL